MDPQQEFDQLTLHQMPTCNLMRTQLYFFNSSIQIVVNKIIELAQHGKERALILLALLSRGSGCAA